MVALGGHDRRRCRVNGSAGCCAQSLHPAGGPLPAAHRCRVHKACRGSWPPPAFGLALWFATVAQNGQGRASPLAPAPSARHPSARWSVRRGRLEGAREPTRRPTPPVTAGAVRWARWYRPGRRCRPGRASASRWPRRSCCPPACGLLGSRCVAPAPGRLPNCAVRPRVRHGRKRIPGAQVGSSSAEAAQAVVIAGGLYTTMRRREVVHRCAARRGVRRSDCAGRLSPQGCTPIGKPDKALRSRRSARLAAAATAPRDAWPRCRSQPTLERTRSLLARRLFPMMCRPDLSRTVFPIARHKPVQTAARAARRAQHDGE